MRNSGSILVENPCVCMTDGLCSHHQINGDHTSMSACNVDDLHICIPRKDLLIELHSRATKRLTEKKQLIKNRPSTVSLCLSQLVLDHRTSQLLGGERLDQSSCNPLGCKNRNHGNYTATTQSPCEHKRRTRNIVRLTIFCQINSRSWFVKPLHEGCRTRRLKTAKPRTRTTVVWYVAFFSVLIALCRKTTRTVRRRTIDEAPYAPKVLIRPTITPDIHHKTRVFL